MKKIIIAALLCLLSCSTLWAQTEKPRKNKEKIKKEYLPKAGDWSIGVDITPVFRYLGNAFNGNTDNDALDNGLGGKPFTSTNDHFRDNLMPDVSIMGKYMLDDNWALRANIGLLIRSDTRRAYVADDKLRLADPFSEEMVVDRARNNRNGVSIALGGEYRKGSRRVQGIFGASLLFAFQNDKTKYMWGNEMTTLNQNPSSSIDLTNGSRPLFEYTEGASFYTGIAGHVGIEYFFAPKMSLGAEVSLTLYYLSGKQTYRESENYNTALNRVEKITTLVSPGDSQFYLGTQSLGGSLYMAFYF